MEYNLEYHITDFSSGGIKYNLGSSADTAYSTTAYKTNVLYK